MRYALVKESMVLEAYDYQNETDMRQHNHPDFWDHMIPTPNQEVKRGWMYRDGVFTEPAAFSYLPEIGERYFPDKRKLEWFFLSLSSKVQSESRRRPESLMESAGYLAALYPQWKPGNAYEPGDLLEYQGKAVQVRQAVTAQAHQPPFSEGMTAIYIPYLVADENGIKPFVYGCATNSGELFYSQGGTVFQYIGVDNPSCIYPPSDELPALWERQNQTGKGGV